MCSFGEHKQGKHGFCCCFPTRKLQLSDSSKDLAKVTLAGESRDGTLVVWLAPQHTVHIALCLLCLKLTHLNTLEEQKRSEVEFSLHSNFCETTGLHSCNNTVLCSVLVWFPLTPRKLTLPGTGVLV